MTATKGNSLFSHDPAYNRVRWVRIDNEAWNLVSGARCVTGSISETLSADYLIGGTAWTHVRQLHQIWSDHLLGDFRLRYGVPHVLARYDLLNREYEARGTFWLVGVYARRVSETLIRRIGDASVGDQPTGLC